MHSRRVCVCIGTVGRDEPVEGDVMEKREPQCRWQTYTSKERGMATKATRKTYGSNYDHERDEQVMNRFQAEATLRLRNKAAHQKQNGRVDEEVGDAAARWQK